MRVLFSSTGGAGHLQPLLPLAVAFAARGDEVKVAAPSNHRARVEGEGLELAEVGPTSDALRAEALAHQHQINRLPVPERRAEAFSGLFGKLEAPARLPGLRSLLEQWSPDVVIYESADLAAPIAAAEAGTRFLNHAFGRAIPEAALKMAADVVAPLWTGVGLDPDPLAGAYAGSYIDICPPSLQTPLPQRPAHTFALRAVDAPDGNGQVRERPVVYATLGTIFNELRTFRLLLDVLGAIDCDVVMTIGRNRTPAELTPIPPNATVSSYIPQTQILDRCDLVIAHGGSGSLLGALAHGRPMVLLPQGADQFDNADACTAIGAAESIRPTELTPEKLHDVIMSVINSPDHTNAARAVATEIAAMPPPSGTTSHIATTLA